MNKVGDYEIREPAYEYQRDKETIIRVIGLSSARELEIFNREAYV